VVDEVPEERMRNDGDCRLLLQSSKAQGSEQQNGKVEVLQYSWLVRFVSYVASPCLNIRCSVSIDA
jgi:hypothetical protein